MSKSNKNAGKGMSPTKGYNPKNWYANYDLVFRKKNKQSYERNTSNTSSKHS